MSGDDVAPSPPAPASPETDPQEEARRAIFATHIAYGSTIPQALEAAGYSDPRIHLGFVLLSYPDVREAIDRHREYIRDKQSRGVKEIIEQLDRDREFAQETRNAATAAACTLAQAKILGMMDPTLNLKNGKERLVITWGGEEDYAPQVKVVGDVGEKTIEAIPTPATGTDDA